MHPQYDHVAWHEIAPGLESSLKMKTADKENRQGLIQSLITIYYRSILELEKICGLMPLRFVKALNETINCSLVSHNYFPLREIKDLFLPKR